MGTIFNAPGWDENKYKYDALVHSNLTTSTKKFITFSVQICNGPVLS